MSLFAITPTLRGRHVTLEPLDYEHAPALADAADAGEMWKLWYTMVPSRDTVAEYVETAIAQRDAGLSLPFVVRDAQGAIVGSTRYCNIAASHRRVEIGYTWYAQRVQRTALNTEAKRLLLAHAFENMQCVVVQFCTHWFNQRSRAAIARLGAKQDGVLRNHMIMPDGSLRDTVVFSVLDTEWPNVRHHLDFCLARGESA